MVSVVKVIDDDYPTSGYDPNAKAIKVQVQGFATSYLIIEYTLDKKIVEIRPTTVNDSFVTLSFYDEDELKRNLQEFINKF